MQIFPEEMMGNIARDIPTKFRVPVISDNYPAVITGPLSTYRATVPGLEKDATNLGYAVPLRGGVPPSLPSPARGAGIAVRPGRRNRPSIKPRTRC